MRAATFSAEPAGTTHPLQSCFTLGQAVGHCFRAVLAHDAPVIVRSGVSAVPVIDMRGPAFGRPFLRAHHKQHGEGPRRQGCRRRLRPAPVHAQSLFCMKM